MGGELLLEIQKLKVKTLALEKQYTDEYSTRAQFPPKLSFIVNAPQISHFRLKKNVNLIYDGHALSLALSIS